TVQKMIEKSAPATPAYEKTMVMKAAEVQEFKDQSYNDWKSESEESLEPPKKATIDMSHADAAAPAFGMDMDFHAPADAAPSTPFAADAPAASGFDMAPAAPSSFETAPELTAVE